MCNACVMESVKNTMLSRRLLFLGAAAAGTAVAASGLLTAKPALAQATGRVVDLTHTFDEAFPTFDGVPGIQKEWAVRMEESGYQLWKLTIFEHSGTHIDAPFHFSADGASVDQLPVEQMVAPLCIVDITEKAAQDPNATVDPEDIEAWVSANGELPGGRAWRCGRAGLPRWALRSSAPTPPAPSPFLASPRPRRTSWPSSGGVDRGGHPEPRPRQLGGLRGAQLLAARGAVRDRGAGGARGAARGGATVFIGAPKHAQGRAGPRASAPERIPVEKFKLKQKTKKTDRQHARGPPSPAVRARQ
jgi:hypothetical protein